MARSKHSLSKALALAAGVLLSAGPAMAATWVPVAESEGGETYEIDLDTIQREADIVHAWYRETYRKPQKAPNGAAYRSTTVESLFDCLRRSGQLLSSVAYDKRGQLAVSRDKPSTTFSVPPDSVPEMLLNVLCAVTAPPQEEALLDDITAGDWVALGTAAKNAYQLSLRMDGILRLDPEFVVALSREDYTAYDYSLGVPVAHTVRATLISCRDGSAAIMGADHYVSPAHRIASERVDEDRLEFHPASKNTFVSIFLSEICAAAVTLDSVSAQEPEQAGGSGTAWGVDKGYLVTASHVVSGAKTISVYRDGKPIGQAEVVLNDAANDLAILKLTTAHKLEVLPLSSKGPSLGRSVFTLGYPMPGVLGQTIKMSAGEISSTSGMKDDARHIQVSMPIQPGNSGGPVLGWDGSVLAVVEAKLTGFGAGPGEPSPEMVNYAIKSSYVRVLLEDLPDLGDYTVIQAAGDPDAMVAAARRAVYLIVAEGEG